jgi:hypothetical protein
VDTVIMCVPQKTKWPPGQPRRFSARQSGSSLLHRRFRLDQAGDARTANHPEYDAETQYYLNASRKIAVSVKIPTDIGRGKRH